MKRALSLLLAGALSLSLLAGCSAAEQLSAEPHFPDRTGAVRP